MARFIVLAFLAAAALVVMAAPAQEYEPLEVAAGEYNNQEEDDHLRFRRLTCDLLSFAGKVGDSACAANCISMGKAGGSCSGGVCKCRKDSVKQVWDNRFGQHG